ncbi:MAG: hypothetical protein KDB11_33770 [Planctomycetales bacterium]|nr:hypothetical protein [Planctomycetales bacterium]
MRTNNFTLDDVEKFAKYFAVLEYDPNSQRSLHFQCSSFYWADEMPEFVDDGHDASIRHFMLYLLSYRKILMYGEDVPAFLPMWNRLKELCPKWPGFRADRMHASLIPELEMETNQELDRLERMINVCNRRKEQRARLAADNEPNRKTT